MAVLKSPQGAVITGTLERLSGVAGISEGTVTSDGEGGFDFDYDGETKVWWDEQKTVVRGGQRIFVDEDGMEWPESQLQLVEDDENSEQP